MGQPHFQVSQQREIGARTGDLFEIQHRRDDRLPKHRTLNQQVSPRARQDRSARKRLAALETHELRQGDVDAVLPRDILCQPAPARQAGGPPRRVVPGNHPARWAGAGHDDQLGAIERGQHRRERMPGILTDEYRCPAPSGIESLDRPAGLDEALLVEHAVRGEKDLAMDMAHTRIGPAKSRV